MKVLVTGASGFIGSRLAGRLISEGDEVYGIIHEKPNTVDGVHVITADLSDSTFDIPDVNFDVVYHLAAATPLVKDKKKQKKINLEGTINLFEKIKNKTNFIIYASGLGVFGNPNNSTVNEESKIQPDTDFVKIRLEAQKFLKNSCEQNKINFSVCYFGDVYGGKLVWKYDCKQAKK